MITEPEAREALRLLRVAMAVTDEPDDARAMADMLLFVLEEDSQFAELLPKLRQDEHNLRQLRRTAKRETGRGGI